MATRFFQHVFLQQFVDILCVTSLRDQIFIFLNIMPALYPDAQSNFAPETVKPFHFSPVKPVGSLR
jgi:hypothetical protein